MFSFTVLIHNIARSVNGQCIRWSFTKPGPLGMTLIRKNLHPFSLFTHDLKHSRLTIMWGTVNDRGRKSTLGTESAVQTSVWPLLVHYGNVKSEALLMDSSDQTRGQSDLSCTYLVAVYAESKRRFTYTTMTIVQCTHKGAPSFHVAQRTLLLVPITAKWKYISPQTNQELWNRPRSLSRKLPRKFFIKNWMR